MAPNNSFTACQNIMDVEHGSTGSTGGTGGTGEVNNIMIAGVCRFF